VTDTQRGTPGAGDRCRDGRYEDPSVRVSSYAIGTDAAVAAVFGYPLVVSGLRLKGDPCDTR